VLLSKNPRDTIIANLIASKKVIKNGRTKIFFDQPYHLYLDKAQSDAYIEMIKAEKFSTQLHDPTLELINKYKSKILANFNGRLSFYDLGPGLPTKTIPLLKYLLEKKIRFDYFPVDISENFLNITNKKIKDIGVKSNRIKTLFENLPEYSAKDKNHEKLFFIGLTFNNYRPDTILKLLKEIAGNDGTCLIITEYFKRKNIETILLPYRDKYAENFNYLSLKLAGIPKESLKYFTVFRNQRIEMGFRILKSLSVDETFHLKKGTEIITAISYRYTKAALLKYISKYFSCFEFFDHQTKDISLVAFKLTNF
jgi:uncharacterized SAM-dependent methyltransferase